MNNADNNALLRVRGLSKEYVQRSPLTRTKFTIHALKNLNLTLRRGATLAVVGESGAGKSTLVRCLALIEKPTAGEIWWNDVDLLGLKKSALFPMRRKIQIIFQDATSALNPGMTAAELVEEPLVIQKIGATDERCARVAELMEQVGLSAKWADKLPMEFSGGQRQRLAIARALALAPELLILDEALSNLDLANQETILQLLRELQSARGLTYIYIAHDLNMVEEVADEVAVMYEGQIVEQKYAPVIFAHAEHPYTQELLAMAPPLKSIIATRQEWDRL
ncbi:MAG TPA: ATP-binding cassette domain-containing protein [Candidatus Acidoferrales bacterium]|nr:ATP-binding cassette domain-containing protein [Candidatus Acidoferrales bacterium]